MLKRTKGKSGRFFYFKNGKRISKKAYDNECNDKVVIPLLEISTKNPKHHLKLTLFTCKPDSIEQKQQEIITDVLDRQSKEGGKKYTMGYKHPGWKKYSKLGKHAAFVGKRNSTVIVIEGHSGYNIGYALLTPRCLEDAVIDLYDINVK